VELWLQYGHGMKGHTLALLRAWGDGGVILSPRDTEPTRLAPLAQEVQRLGREVLLDPQCFVHDADHERLLRHDYWAAYRSCSTDNLLSGAGADELVTNITALNLALGTKRLILPGLLADPVDENWLTLQARIVAASHSTHKHLLATVALSEAAVRDEVQVEAIVDAARSWPVEGIYLVAETPSAYLVDDPTWLANVAILVGGLRLAGKSVLVGHANHQLLFLSAVKVNALASGTWRNVRAFPPAKFYKPAEDDISRRAVWYYCPRALSEYKIPYLDIAFRRGVLAQMAPSPRTDPDFAAPLFGGALPSVVNWQEGTAFRHYLSCLRLQCHTLTANSYASAREAQESMLDDADALLQVLRANGIFGQDREFHDLADANRSALISLDAALGPRLRHEWSTITS
jgi:hypothetical protein